ncbi:hypothetical protein BTR14_14075 [Rhizobium rhizosphaerae]|uniref:Uncharacterized protein n=1 Tax=Xaviernesmea rhizosphaerae TaxID=1672749 RepID=A0ABX3PCY8_9HYPH|nr:hypothetical protein BTR14_14075 [Xaviernesmea rhizosphaerae]
MDQGIGDTPRCPSFNTVLHFMAAAAQEGVCGLGRGQGRGLGAGDMMGLALLRMRLACRFRHGGDDAALASKGLRTKRDG